MNPSTACATVLVDELVRHGVREAVLCPGSRSAPLAYALHAAAAADRLRLHVRIDERTAGFLALGLARRYGRPVPVVTTSGTAAANLHPAVVEASESGVPLLLLTADRPPELRGSGANQTIDQVKLFGADVRWFHDLGAPEARPGQNAYWRSLAGRAVLAARGDLGGDPGPVHVNVALREPLVPADAPDWPEPLAGRPGGRAWTAAPDPTTPPPGFPAWAGNYAGDARTVVLVGDCPPATATAGAALAAARGWPLVAEPLTPARAAALGTGALLIGDSGFLAAHRPDRLLVLGRPTLSRALGALRRDPRVAVDVVAASARWADPAGTAERVLAADASWRAADPAAGGRPGGQPASDPAGPVGDSAFRAAWEAAAAAAQHAVEAFLAAEPWPTGLHVAGAVARALAAAVPAGPGPLLVLGSSSVVRDLDLVGTWPAGGVHVVANRGAAGIDGTVSTAVGAALAHQRDGGGSAYALLGDLTFLHDATGLVLGPAEARPDLTLVVVNDDGGGIFSLLEQGAPDYASAFERVFGTPHGVDLAALCAATATSCVRAATEGELRAALRPAPGLRVVEVRVDRRRGRDVHARLRAAVAAALAGQALAPDDAPR